MTWGGIGPEGPPGADGAPGTTGALYTNGAPSNGTGVDGDIAYDPVAQVWYGPKALGVWPAAFTGPYGRRAARLTSPLAFTATQTQTVHTISLTDNKSSLVTVLYAAVPAVNDGSGNGLIAHYYALCRKASGTVNVPGSASTPVNVKTTPLNSASFDITSSGGNILVRFSTSSGAASLIQCDVYIQDGT